ncbi:MAG: hypothetical protein O7F17_02515, partial [Planctomycetota bacterium]|nr:hypothetical protein [Planctomycetota bacterium]
VNQDEFRNANGFTGKTTPGLININTATPEVMRSAPHIYKLVYETDNLPLGEPAVNLRVALPEAIVQYRERFAPDPMNPNDFRPNYSVRDSVVPDLRPERGMASIGEVLLLNKPGAADIMEPTGEVIYLDAWRVDWAGRGPFVDPAGLVYSTQISTDVNNPEIGGVTQPDIVATDVEEQNLLFAGISNLITTRSDMFTVYFKVRSFRQNRVTGIWDATDPEYIVDDSRYVMLVDRSEVNRPTDKPKILYLEKLPK